MRLVRQKARPDPECSAVGDNRPDAKLANEAVGLKGTPDGYVWHHVEDGKTMQLIPKDIHDAFPHTGGASIIRNGP